MIAVKANRQYTITEADVDSFVKDGYDVFDDMGNLVRYGAGKAVSFEKYANLLEDYEKLMDENARLNDEVVTLTAKLAEKKASRSRRKAEKADEKTDEKED